MKKLSSKIVSAIILIGVAATLPAGWLGYSGTKHLLEEEAFDKLTAVRESKKREIERYFDIIRGQIVTLSEDLMVVTALHEFIKGFHQLPPAPANSPGMLASINEFYAQLIDTKFGQNGEQAPTVATLTPGAQTASHWQYHFIANNPYPLGQKDRLAALEARSPYSQSHALYHPKLRNYLDTFGYYDIFLIDMQGNIVYSVYKESDFATNLVDGPYRESNLAKVFDSLRQAPDSKAMSVMDFAPYLPSYNAPAGFIGSPVFRDDEQIGVLVFQIPIRVINEIMTGQLHWMQDGLGESGETYLLGPDLGMRNDSRFLLQDRTQFLRQMKAQGGPTDSINAIARHNTTVLYQTVDTVGSRAALAGVTDTRVINDYRNVSVLSSFAPIDLGGLRWAIVSEIDHDEVFAPIQDMRLSLIYLSLAIGSVVIMLGFLFAKRLTEPLEELALTSRDISIGDFRKRVRVQSRDEIGTLAQAFNTMAESLENTMVSKAYVDKILSSMNEALFVLQFEPEGKQLNIENINPAAAHILGYDYSDIVGRSIDLFFEGNALTEEDWYLLMRQSSLPTMDRNLVTRTGKKIPVIFSVSIMEDEMGMKSEVICVCVIQDITERKRAEEKLQLAGIVYQAAAEAIMVLGKDRKITDINPAFELITGYSRKGVMGKHPRLLESSDNIHAFYDLMLEKIEKERYWRGEFSGQRKHGTLLPMIVSITALTDESGDVCRFVCIMSDVSELKEREARTWVMANFDPLTDLPNRNLFGDRLEQSMRNAQRNDEAMALLFVDMDGFKAVNDLHGHTIGDALLRHAAARMQRDLRGTDSLARIGGDEFTVILVDLEPHKDAEYVAEKLLEAMLEPFEISGNRITLTISIGIAYYPEQAKNGKDLMRKADLAMYMAKSAGKNTYRTYAGGIDLA